MPFAGKHVLHGRLAEWPELRSRDPRVHTQKLLSQGKGFTGAKEYGGCLRDGRDWLISLSNCSESERNLSKRCKLGLCSRVHGSGQILRQSAENRGRTQVHVCSHQIVELQNSMLKFSKTSVPRQKVVHLRNE
jgi:hypothetical protein